MNELQQRVGGRAASKLTVHATNPQKVLVFQENGSGVSKIQGILRFGEDLFDITIISINVALPPVIDDAEEYLPDAIDSDLVLDYLKHPDLSHDLAVLCSRHNIPVVASGKKLRVPGVLTPPTCCGLSHKACLGLYGERFGAPEFTVEVVQERVAGITVLRGAPCGATWDAAARVLGGPVAEAALRIGLETQYFCTANPAGWDPMYGKSPVHFAGDVHAAAMSRALQRD
jgi:thymidylate synthase